jgi:hypothetical protein
VLAIALIYLYGNDFSSLKSSNKPATYGVGQSVVIESIVFNVSSIKRSSGTDSDILTVSYSAKNNGKKEVTIGSSNIKLVDNQNRKFESQLSLDAPGKLNPGIMKDGKAEIEVPKDAEGLLVAIRTDMVDFGGADYVYVRVP